MVWEDCFGEKTGFKLETNDCIQNQVHTAIKGAIKGKSVSKVPKSRAWLLWSTRGKVIKLEAELGRKGEEV